MGFLFSFVKLSSQKSSNRNGVYKCLLKGSYSRVMDIHTQKTFQHVPPILIMVFVRGLFPFRKWSKILVHNHNGVYKYHWAYKALYQISKYIEVGIIARPGGSYGDSGDLPPFLQIHLTLF